MTRPDYIRIALALHRASKCEVGRSVMDIMFEELVESIADILAADPEFDRAAWEDVVALRSEI